MISLGLYPCVNKFKFYLRVKQVKSVYAIASVCHGFKFVIALPASIALFFLLLALPLTSNLSPLTSPVASAATSNQLNFQGRLLTSTGSLVPDGNYNLEFKLYNQLTSAGSTQGSCIGDSNCLWTETRSSVTLRNGYFSVYLGDTNPLPTGIDWSQDLFLGMNVGGTGVATWDGEMTPRFKLTSVPYAFRANSAETLSRADGGFTSTLGITTPTQNNTINLPNESGDVCLTSGNCAGVGGTGDILDGGQAGAISIGTTDATTVSLLQNGSAALTVNASQLIQFNAYNCSTFTNGGTLTTDASGNVICANDEGGGASSAPTGAQYLTLALDATLTDERVLTAGSNISIVDTGANGTLTVNVVNSPSFSGTLDVTQSVAFQRGTDYSNIGTTNDVVFADASLIRLTGASAQTITGIAGGRNGELLTIINAGTTTASLANESASSTVANRITTGTAADLPLPTGGSISLVYDSGASRWRITSAVAGSSGSGATSVTNDTNVTGSITANNLTLGWTGQLSVARGGTGAGTFTQNGVIYGNTAGTLQATVAGTSGQVLVANGSGIPTFVTISGDITINATGAATIATNAVDSNELASTTVTAGSYGSASSVGTFTVDADGRLTTAGSSSIAIAGSQITSGTVADARLSTNVALLNTAQTFTGAKTFSALTTLNGGLTVEAGDAFTFNGTAFTNLVGTGLQVTAGVLQTTLGTSIESSEITNATITGTDIAAGTVANTNLANSQIGVNTGSGLQGGGNISLGGSRNLSLGDLSADWVQSGGFDLVLNNAGSELRILEATGGLFYGEFDVADLNATRLYTFPDVSGEVSVLGQTIENGELANSSLTINTSSGISGGGIVSLGGSLSLSASLGTDIDTSEVVNGTLLAVDYSTTNALGAGVNGYVYTYNNTTGNFTLVDAATIGGTGGVTSLNGLAGALSVVGNTQLAVSAVGSNINLSINADSITAGQLAANSIGASELASTTVAAGTYNTANQVRSFTVDTDGRLTAAGNVNIAIAASQITSGILSVDRGGTGAGTFTSNGVVYGNGTGALLASAAGIGGQVLIADALGVPTFISFSGDLSVSDTGVTTISGDAVGSSEVLDNSLTASDLATGSVATDEILDDTILAADINYTNAPLTVTEDNYILTYDNATGGFTWVDSGSVGATLTEAEVEDYIFDADNGVKTLSSGVLALNSLTYTGNLNVAQGGTGMTTAGAAGGVFYSNGTAFANTGAGSAGQCLLSGGAGVPTWSTCGGSGVGATTLQVTYDNGNTITTTDNRNILFTLANTTTDSNFLANIATGSTSKSAFQLNGVDLLRIDSAGVDLIDVDIADFTAATVTFDAGEILETEITQNSLDDSEIEDNSLTAASLAADSVAASELASSGVTLGSYGSASSVATFTVDVDGRLTTAATTAIAINASAINAGTLSVARGGTGAGTFTQNGIIYGNTTGALQATAAGTGGQVLLANATGIPTFTTLTGDLAVSDTGVTSIGADSVALGTDTTGDYVSNITGGTGVAVSGTIGENWTPTVALSYSDTLASNTLGSSESTFSTNGLLLEGAISDGFETYLTVTNPTADNTISLPNASGTVAVSASGNITLSAAGALSITGQIPVANGGTGASTLANGVLFGNGTAAITSTGVLTNGQLIIGDGAGNPSIGTLTGGTGITVTNGAGTISLASTLGVSVEGTEITNNTIEAVDLEVTNAPINGYVLSYDSTTGGFTWIAPGAFATDEATVESYIFDADNTGTLSSGTLALNSLTYTGNLGVSNGGTGLTAAGAAGGVFYSTGSAFANTGAGTSGQCLISNGAAAPSWAACGGGGGPTTLQVAYDNGNTITTTDNRNIAFNLADTTIDSGFIVDLQGAGSVFDVQDGTVSKLTVEGTTGFVGVNDSTPSFQLDVAGTGRFTNDLQVDGNTLLGNATTDVITVTGSANFNSSQLNVVQSTGFVGIGAPIPGYKLDVVGQINASAGYRVNGVNGGTVTCAVNNYLESIVVSGGIITGGTCGADIDTNSGGTVTGSGAAGYLTYWSGIGSITGVSTLTVSGSGLTVGTLNTGLGANELYAMNQAVLTTSAVSFGTLNTGLGANELYPMNQAVLSTSAVSFATLNTGLGANELYAMNQAVLTTSAVTHASMTATTLAVGGSTISFTESALTANALRINGGIGVRVFGAVSASQGIGFGATGVVGTTTTVCRTTGAADPDLGTIYRVGFCGTSSGRYKNTIVDYTGGLDEVRGLRPVTYYYNDDYLPGAGLQVGFIAEEVEQVDSLFATYENGRIEGVDYPKVAVLLTNAVQDVDLIVQSNTANINALGSRLTVLESATTNLTKANLTVTNTISTVNLTVTGTATIANLTVTGVTDLADLKVDRIISKGNTPTAVLSATTTGQGSTTVIEGNDTAGSISFTTGTGTAQNPLASGGQATITFNTVFTTVPRVTLTPTTEAAANTNYFITKTNDKFIIHFTQTPTATTSYSFDYQIIQ